MAVVAREKSDLERMLDETRGHGWRKALAGEMGVSRVSLHNWLTGRKPWPEERVTQLCGLLGVERAVYFEGGPG